MAAWEVVSAYSAARSIHTLRSKDRDSVLISPVTGMAFSPDGRTVALAFREEIQIWNARAPALLPPLTLQRKIPGA